MEHEDDITGGNYTTEYRLYDARIARWFTIDPKIKANESPYCWVTNNPIVYMDPSGADSTQRATAVAKALDYVAKNTKPGKSQYVMGAKTNEPGKGPIDCSGLITKCVKAAGEKDPNAGYESSGVLNIQKNTLTMNVNDVQVGYLITFYKKKGYAYHVGIVTNIVYDENGVATITYAHSQGGKGPMVTTFTIGDNSRSNEILYGFYKWDTKPDYNLQLLPKSDRILAQSYINSIRTCAQLAAWDANRLVTDENDNVVTEINPLDQYWLNRQHQEILNLNTLLNKYGQVYEK